MANKQGKISVETENIFPIIKQWLYSDQDIFIRELVSNAADAITKRQRLAAIGKLAGDLPQARIDVVLNPAQESLTISDNGIGMTAEELDKYINRIAYSGLVDFVEKYQDKEMTGGSENSIIGHFGLGFYSAFMVADRVEIQTLSAELAAEPVCWQSHEGIDYEMSTGSRKEPGTDIIIHLDNEALSRYDGQNVQAILGKYCNFMPYEIYFREINPTTEGEKEENQAPVLLNDTEPLWLKSPSEIADQEYKDFYKKSFQQFRDPLFWIHLNLDYPFRLKGILYFPADENIHGSLEGRIKIYYNQVFVADNIPEIIPDFLFLLRGHLDCPDLPLNVSRSFLQGDDYVKKLSQHIVRKVADKLVSLFKSDRQQFEKWWPAISVFVRYGMMRESKFYDRAKEVLLFETTDGSYRSLAELGEGTIEYVSEKDSLLPYVEMAKARGKEVVVMDQEIDNQFMSFLEFQSQARYRFERVDAELDTSSVTEKELSGEDRDHLGQLFRKISGNNQLKLEFRQLGQALPILLRETEEGRRMKEMREQFLKYQSDQADGQDELDKLAEMFPEETLLVINEENDLMRLLSKQTEAKQEWIGHYLWQLAQLAQGKLTGPDFTSFIDRSAELIAAEMEEDGPQGD